VELAAIQGLNQKLNEKEAEIQALKQRVETLERLLTQKSGGDK
jgi:predicted RNase H-like nuclease (RuvC/YqgF family)